jgi:AAA+ lid domain
MCQLGVRDLTRLFGGLCQTQPQNFSKPETLVRVWRHEIYRVFADRLESDEVRSKYINGGVCFIKGWLFAGSSDDSKPGAGVNQGVL